MVASAYAVEFVRGFQGDNLKAGSGIGSGFAEARVLEDDVGDDDRSGDLMLSACCKHLTAYDLEKWAQFSRYNFNAVVSFCFLCSDSIWV